MSKHKQPERIARELEKVVREQGKAKRAEVSAARVKRARVVAQAGVRVPSQRTATRTMQRGETRLGTGTRAAALRGAPQRAQRKGVR